MLSEIKLSAACRVFDGLSQLPQTLDLSQYSPTGQSPGLNSGFVFYYWLSELQEKLCDKYSFLPQTCRVGLGRAGGIIWKINTVHCGSWGMSGLQGFSEIPLERWVMGRAGLLDFPCGQGLVRVWTELTNPSCRMGTITPMLKGECKDEY